ncbi:MAG: hypothetical protein K2H41_12625 [Acetatifactor sp.]|nr:hypothetical protein [Acetatifactor sp.]
MLKPDNKNNNSLTPMVALYCLAILVLCMILLFRSITAHAAEDDVIHLEEAYTVNWNAFDINDNTKKTYDYNFVISNGYPMFFVYHENNGGYSLGEYIKSDETAYYMARTGNHTGILVQGSYVVGNLESSKIDLELNYPMDPANKLYSSLVDKFYGVGMDLGSLSFNCNCYVFDSLESAQAYYKNGDISGVVSRPGPDYDYDHDFREDVYDASIPVPELSNLSHNGFHVNNADPTRDIEIYIESTFYGLKHNTSGSTVETDATSRPILFTYDSSWVIGTHRFNLINTDISYSDADINIKEMFKCDNVGALIGDFKEWSKEYPKHENLPDYTWYKFQNDHYTNDYRNYHLYSHSVGKTEEEKLKLSAQASTTYRVRFCQYIPGEGYTWGKWATYIYTPAGYGHKDNTTVGDTEADPDTGRPIIKDPKPGLQDPDGNITFPDKFAPSNLGEMIEDVMGTLQGMSSFFGEFPAFLASTFAFIPSFIWAIIGAGLIFVIIVTIIKAVLSLK